MIVGFYLYKFLFILTFLIANLQAALIGSNFSQRDIQVLKELDIHPSYITDYNLHRTYNRILNGTQKRYVRKFNEASLFVPKLKEILNEQDIPATFLYMAMAESNFTIDARSYVRATGLWQFMSGTARRYGLKNNVYVDERMDLVKSTYAATRYLKHLHNKFGKWYLAAIAYNCGEGRVIEAITRSSIDMYEAKFGKKNQYSADIKKYRRTIRLYQEKRVKFRELFKIYKKVITWGVEPDIYQMLVVQKGIKRQYIPNESREYIRKIISLAMMNNQSFITDNDNSHLRNIGLTSNIATVNVKGGLHLQNIAKAIGMKSKALKKLNKHIKRDIIPTYVKEYPIHIPYSRLSRFNQNKSSIKPTVYAIHTVKRGDNLSSIGRKYGISYKFIMKFNGLKTNRLSLKQKLVIPGKLAKVSDRIAVKKARKVRKANYKVRRGDTLLGIAKRYSTDVKKLMADNNLKTSLIRQGDRIVIK